ncbi:hypothetical protein Dthio_PD0973 [Desulfonatronospira thiodismutans ASO3-1]|uniref:Uncharacterized protein n=1 Tax=Desulfonatronospira thiodismutans ASO3-1 TaxID=555779 RepID=D6SSH2_9BACT|nr:hypothetical protein Dthio_PD0973 [Desulfonatronospira thiodismutans ASO3-1]
MFIRKGAHTTTPDPSLAKEGSYTVPWTYLGGESLIKIQTQNLYRCMRQNVATPQSAPLKKYGSRGVWEYGSKNIFTPTHGYPHTPILSS